MFIDKDPCIDCNNGIGYSPNSTVSEPVRSEQKEKYDLARKLLTEYEMKFGRKYIYPIPTCLPVEVFVDDLLHHLNGERYNMTNEEIYENIAIARRELEELHLLVPDNKVFLYPYLYTPLCNPASAGSACIRTGSPPLPGPGCLPATSFYRIYFPPAEIT